TLIEPSEIQFELTPITPPCTDATNGQIILNNITGGAGNYTYALDGNNGGVIQNTSTIIDFVESGDHVVTLTDMNGCLATETTFVPSSNEIEMNLGDDQTIELGDSVQLFPIYNFVPAGVIWSANTPCSDCLNQFVSPTYQTTYTLTMLNDEGCVTTDAITILVEKNRHVFIPNVFSPDDNGFNDIFYINAGQDVKEVKNFRIYNRWGAEIFVQEHFQPNDPLMGWDGTFKNKNMNPGVFVYFAEIEFLDGRVEIYKGDVTLKR
ncbi:MAG TPA: T9SS type B sorting domain-containing protein, partial [Phaeodactylibacter sp.]|nr:T9SS type B sorting domain-containing protein [Phaeodactylibacter sp.]